MKKNKILTGVMLAIVLSIWSYNLIGISVAFNEEEDLEEDVHSNQPPRNQAISPMNSPKLVLDYADPFLKSIDNEYIPQLNQDKPASGDHQGPSKTKRPPSTKSDVSTEVTARIPKITYHGFIKNRNDTAQKIGVFKFDHEQILMKEGDMIDKLTLHSVKRESAVFRHTKGDRISVSKE